MAAKHNGGSGKMAKSSQSGKRGAAAATKAKASAPETSTVGRMLSNVKAKLAGLRNNKVETAHNATVAAVVDLAKKRDAKKKAQKETAKKTAKGTSLKAAFGKKKEAGFAERADNANVRSITKQAGRKGGNAQPARDDLGSRHR